MGVEVTCERRLRALQAAELMLLVIWLIFHPTARALQEGAVPACLAPLCF